MARRSASLKPHLNQIRTWVGEGVTDIWIAHQLESTPASIAAFRRRHGLTRPPQVGTNPAVAAAGLATAAPLAGEPEETLEGGGEALDVDEPASEAEAGTDEAEAVDDESAPARRRRRGRRGGRGRRRRRTVTATVTVEGEDLVVHLAGVTAETRAAWEGRADAMVEIDEASITLRAAGESESEE